MPRIRLGAVVLLLLLAFPLAFFAGAQQTPQTPPPEQSAQPPAQQTPPAEQPVPDEAAAVPSCGDCHEIAAPFVRNPHARGSVEDGVVPNAICESCHGDGTAHMEAGGDPTLITRPAGFAGSQECLTCHDVSTQEKSRRQGVHANAQAVNCLTCHSIHHNEPLAKSLLAKKEVEVCSTCHATYVAGLRNKPFGHRVGRGGMECSSCHEPHKALNREPVRRTRAGETACAECHTDKKGPFVFPHGANEVFAPGQECMNCHEVHGSNNPKQLRRANVWQLCTECHAPITGTTLGSQPPSFHNLNLPRYQNCTSCHVAVHGSNRSPQLFK